MSADEQDDWRLLFGSEGDPKIEASQSNPDVPRHQSVGLRGTFVDDPVTSALVSPDPEEGSVPLNIAKKVANTIPPGHHKP